MSFTSFTSNQRNSLTSTGAAIYTVGIEGIMKELQVSQTMALLGLTLFIVGYGIGPIIWCPISELPAVGRNPVYIGTLVVFVAFQPVIIYANNIHMLLAFRFLTGFFGSPALALGGATAADMYSPQKMNYAISVWGAAAAFGPALGTFNTLNMDLSNVYRSCFRRLCCPIQRLDLANLGTHVVVWILPRHAYLLSARDT